MKKKAKKPFLNMDERNKQIAYKVISVMYFITILSMQGLLLYRQFVLGQEIGEFEDVAVIVTINSIFLISALLYFGAIPVQKIEIKKIVWIYILLVVLGSLFTYLKYNVFNSPGLSAKQLFGKLIIIVAIIGIFMGFLILFSILGKRKTEKELED